MYFECKLAYQEKQGRGKAIWKISRFDWVFGMGGFPKYYLRIWCAILILFCSLFHISIFIDHKYKVSLPPLKPNILPFILKQNNEFILNKGRQTSPRI